MPAPKPASTKMARLHRFVPALPAYGDTPISLPIKSPVADKH